MPSLDFSVVLRYFPDLLGGLAVTLVLTVIAMAIGTSTGLLLALLRMSSRRVISLPTSLYIDFWRTTPLLIQIIWMYFVFPELVGLDYDIFAAACLAIGLNTGAFLAEVFRAAITAVPRGQWDASRVLGLSPFRTFRLVIAPQAFRIVLPPFTAMTMLTLKGTSIAAILGVLELTRRGQLVTTVTFRPLEVLTVVALMYFVVIYPISIYAGRLERRLRVSDRSSVS